MYASSVLWTNMSSLPAHVFAGSLRIHSSNSARGYYSIAVGLPIFGCESMSIAHWPGFRVVQQCVTVPEQLASNRFVLVQQDVASASRL